MIGRSEKEVGITMSSSDTGIAHKARELLHDLPLTLTLTLTLTLNLTLPLTRTARARCWPT